ncbi:glycosyltransferase [Candidatus Tisiphia endosymbiont of Beris chalybata]|uniref:glycosyltransferase n=1 Tax=Candidatus Tisiphia endosymbiont of Beris chalybata TaxID=3066262 RepID=UPI00312CB2C9
MNTDILLIASIEEGTPLPLIEAMAFGCAIISTNVGIVREVLPTIQHEFIINRQPVELVEAIKKLNNQRELLATIKEQNFIAYQKIFGDNTYLQNLWFNFIEESINNNATKHKLRIRHQVLHTITCVDPSFVNKGLQKILRVSWIKEIAKYFLKYCGVQEGVKLIISVYLYFFSNSEYKNFQKFIPQYQSRQVRGQERNVYVLYTELFPGVANSTKKLFNNTIPFPAGSLPKLLRRINPYLPEKIITQIAKLIIDSDIKKLIISGGVGVHVQLVEKLQEIKRDKSLEVYLLWHGSPAQWVDIGHCHDFYKWLNLYRQNKIQGIITLKKGLEEFLKSNSIPSYLLQNFIPNMEEKKLIPSTRHKFRIGLWSASTIWIKNLYPQIAALTMFQGKISCHTNFHFDNNKYTSWMQESLDIKIFPERLAHQELLNLIAETDLTLYITNSECSPMIVLESLSLSVPCLVGPTADIYDDVFLRDMLTVNRVDCPLTIYNAIEKIRQNIDIIHSKLPDFINKYNHNAVYLKSTFLTSINE